MSKAAAAPAPSAPPQDTPPLAIKGFLETSFLDWKGKISSVIFLPGCNFSCPFCHNFDLVRAPDKYVSLTLDEVLTRLEGFVGWIDGVVISGGEPTLYPGLAWLARTIKDAGFAVKLDTNGHKPEVLEELINQGLVDYVAMDLKAPLREDAYNTVTGRKVYLDNIRRSIELLMGSGLDYEFRSTILPSWHGRDELMAMGEAIKGCKAWTLQALDPTSAWKKEALEGPAYTAEEVDALQIEMTKAFCG